MSKFADFWGRPSDSSFFDHHHFVFQAVFGGEIFFSQQIFWIFGAPASEMHTITEYNSPDLWTFCKSYGGAQKRCDRYSLSRLMYQSQPVVNIIIISDWQEYPLRDFQDGKGYM